MAGAAGLAFPHVFHGRLVRAALGLEQVGMATVAALKRLNVYGVREGDVTDVFVLEDNVAGMAFVAVTGIGYTESCRPVMAGAAGLSFPHVFHGRVVAVVLLLEDFRVAFFTLVAMYFMAVNDLADGFGLYVNYPHRPLSKGSHITCIESGRQRNYKENDQQEPVF